MNTTFTIYSLDTGLIVRSGECPADDIALQAGSDEGATPGSFSEHEHYWDGQQMAPFPSARPTAHHVFDRASGSWSDPRPLEQIKTARWEYIKRVRTEKLESGFLSQGHPFQSDPESKTNIIGAAQLAQVLGASFSNTWTCADNSVVVLNSTQMIQVGLDLGIHTNAMHGIARGLREQIDAATSSAEVEAVVWPS